MTQHELIVLLNQQHEKFGRLPTRIEFEQSFVGGKYALEKLFGNYTNLIKASNIGQAKKAVEQTEEKKIVQTEILLKKYKSLCLKKELLSGFHLHTLNLADIFARAGNPPVLKVSVQPDTHVKYIDERAFRSYLKFLQFYKPDVRIILGDFLDCDGVSHWPSDSLTPRRLVHEAIDARRYLKQLQDASPSASTLIYLKGNHEYWIEQALCKMPELFDGLDLLGLDITLSKLLDLEKFEYQLFELNHLVQIGRANFTHGLYTGGNHAKKHLDVFKANVFYGHLHDYQAFSQASLGGTIEAASLGCLSRTDARFLKGRPNNWNQGHGVFEFFPDGRFVRYQVPIYDGRSTFCGQIFDGNN